MEEDEETETENGNKPYSLKVYAMENVFNMMSQQEQFQILKRISPLMDYIAIDIPCIKTLHNKLSYYKKYLNNERFVLLYVEGNTIPINVYNKEEENAICSAFDKYLNRSLVLRNCSVFEAERIVKELQNSGIICNKVLTWFAKGYDILNVSIEDKIFNVKLLTLYYDTIEGTCLEE